jgi:hypothetical protein
MEDSRFLCVFMRTEWYGTYTCRELAAHPNRLYRGSQAHKIIMTLPQQDTCYCSIASPILRPFKRNGLLQNPHRLYLRHAQCLPRFRLHSPTWRHTNPRRRPHEQRPTIRNPQSASLAARNQLRTQGRNSRKPRHRPGRELPQSIRRRRSNAAPPDDARRRQDHLPRAREQSTHSQRDASQGFRLAFLASFFFCFETMGISIPPFSSPRTMVEHPIRYYHSHHAHAASRTSRQQCALDTRWMSCAFTSTVPHQASIACLRPLPRRKRRAGSILERRG